MTPRYIFALLAGITAVTLFSPASAQSPTTFNTAVRNYAYVGKTGLNANVATIRLHISSNPAAPDGAFDTGKAVTFSNVTAQSLNAAGINGKDGYLYALEYYYAGPASQAASLYRVGANAVAERIGIVPGPTSTDAGRTIVSSFVNLASGMVDSAGDYWFTGYTYHALGLFPTAADLDFFLGKLSGISNLTTSNVNTTLSPTYYHLNISDTTFQRGMTNLMRQQVAMVAYALPATNADGGWQDMDINPANGQFYSYIGFPSTPTAIFTNPYPKPPMQSYLARIDNTVTPWKIRVINATSPTTTPNREEDGAWFDGTGTMYVGFTDSNYARVNLTTGLLDTIANSSLPLFNGNLRGDFATNTPFAQIITGPPLPVQLVSFGAKPSGQGSEVYWNTGVEEGVDHFEVQRSADGREFSTIAFAQPKGSNSSYSISDNPAGNTVYYRLRMADADGSAAYSQIVKWSGKSKGVDAAIYPSIITDGMLHLSLPQTGATIRIYTLAGVAVQTASFDGMAAHPMMPLSLPSATYLVRMADAASGALLTSVRIMMP